MNKTKLRLTKDQYKEIDDDFIKEKHLNVIKETKQELINYIQLHKHDKDKQMRIYNLRKEVLLINKLIKEITKKEINIQKVINIQLKINDFSKKRNFKIK